MLYLIVATLQAAIRNESTSLTITKGVQYFQISENILSGFQQRSLVSLYLQSDIVRNMAGAY